MGLDLIKGVVRNNLEAGVVELAISKVKSMRFATRLQSRFFASMISSSCLSQPGAPGM